MKPVCPVLILMIPKLGVVLAINLCTVNNASFNLTFMLDDIKHRLPATTVKSNISIHKRYSLRPMTNCEVSTAHGNMLSKHSDSETVHPC